MPTSAAAERQSNGSETTDVGRRADAPDGGSGKGPSKSQARLSVNMGSATATALKDLMASGETTATETVRRAISLLAFVEAEKSRGNAFAVVEPGGPEGDRLIREIVLGI